MDDTIKQHVFFKNIFLKQHLIKYRVHVEIEYFIALCNSEIIQLQEFPKEKFKIFKTDLRKILMKLML